MKNYMEDLFLKGVYPGCNYAIIGNLVEKGCIGNKMLIPKKEINTLETIYDMASLTKVLVTVTVLTKLVERKKINLQDKVKDYLSNYQYDSTIYDLMTHTSGLSADFSYDVVCSFQTKEELIKAIYSEPLSYIPKSDIVYSDLGYLLLGIIIEKVLNKPLHIVASEEVFVPLKMNNTTYNPINKDICAPTEVTKDRGIIKGIVHDEKTLLMGGCSGAAGVFSNLEDIIKFVEMILNDGVVDNKPFISKEMIDLWLTPLVTDKKGNKRSLCWICGHSIVSGNLCSESTIAFTGFTGPTIVIDKEKRIGFILLTNRIHPFRKNKKLLIERSNIMNKVIQRVGKIA